MLFLRSLLFNVALYLVTIVMILGTWPLAFLGSPAANRRLARNWAKTCLALLRAIVGTKVEVRGLDNLPAGGAILASKHQSMFETFALFPFIDDLTVVMKRELMHIPFFGWYARRAEMIPVDRDRGPSALRALAARVEDAVTAGRRVLIVPEGTRRPPGAEPAYRTGIAHLYRALDAPVVPAALNSGLFWPRRKFLRHPGTIIVEFLPAIPPGRPPKRFLAELQEAIETASDRLAREAGWSESR
jgi:1-acyl-sn-glycerol-3-phosphate acyltransferase